MRDELLWDEFLRKLEQAFLVGSTADGICASEDDGIIKVSAFDVEPAGVCGDPRLGPTAHDTQLALIFMDDGQKQLLEQMECALTIVWESDDGGPCSEHMDWMRKQASLLKYRGSKHYAIKEILK